MLSADTTAPAFATFLGACGALLDADGDPADLGADLSSFYARVWAQLVAVLADGDEGDVHALTRKAAP